MDADSGAMLFSSDRPVFTRPATSCGGRAFSSVQERPSGESWTLWVRGVSRK